jgi:ABC-2 type transport system ATP-binding protein
MIKVQHVSKRFGTRTVLHDLSFSVERGEIVAFLGPNGAGKTTTMRILTCFMPATEGTAEIAGFNGAEHPQEVKRRVGYLPESPPLYQELTVSEYLRFVGRLKLMPSDDIARRMTEVIEQLELGDVQSRVIGHLSRGFRQRVGLAQALLHNPPVLILDEPTVGLDPKQILEIRHLIQSLTGSHTIILSTHILPEATAVCQRVIIIHQGRIVAVDTPKQLSARLQRSERISLTVKHATQGFSNNLEKLDGVTNVTLGSTPNTFLIDSQPGMDLREQLVSLSTKDDIGLLELKSIPMSLEDVFLQLTQNKSLDSSTEDKNLGNSSTPFAQEPPTP